MRRERPQGVFFAADFTQTQTIAVYIAQLSQPALGNHHQGASYIQGQFAKSLGLVDIQTQGLFDEDVLAGLQALAHQGPVGDGRCGDGQGLDAVIRQQIIDALVNRGLWILGGVLLPYLGTIVKKPLQSPQDIVVAQQVLAPIARAEDADFDHFATANFILEKRKKR